MVSRFRGRYSKGTAEAVARFFQTPFASPIIHLQLLRQDADKHRQRPMVCSECSHGAGNGFMLSLTLWSYNSEALLWLQCAIAPCALCRLLR